MTFQFLYIFYAEVPLAKNGFLITWFLYQWAPFPMKCFILSLDVIQCLGLTHTVKLKTIILGSQLCITILWSPLLVKNLIPHTLLKRVRSSAPENCKVIPLLKRNHLRPNMSWSPGSFLKSRTKFSKWSMKQLPAPAMKWHTSNKSEEHNKL
jgi:hypothetical protein